MQVIFVPSVMHVFVLIVRVAAIKRGFLLSTLDERSLSPDPKILLIAIWGVWGCGQNILLTSTTPHFLNLEYPRAVNT